LPTRSISPVEFLRPGSILGTRIAAGEAAAEWREGEAGSGGRRKKREEEKEVEEGEGGGKRASVTDEGRAAAGEARE
jgi:hypothetical protein